MLTLLLFLAVLGALVAIHEFGHFWMARRLGVGVEEFGFGFPPRLIGWRRRGTIYSLNLIPFGGFVRLRGEDGAPGTDPTSFANASRGRRALIIGSGVVMNALLAALFLSVVYAIGVPTDRAALRPGARVTNPSVLVSAVLPDSPAAQANLAAGDQILAVNDQPVADDDVVRRLIREHPDQPLTLQLEGPSGVRSTTVTPERVAESGEGRIGLALATVVTARYPLHWAVANGVGSTVLFSGEILRAFGGLLRSIVVERQLTEDITGPVGVAILTGQAADLGLLILLQFVALLSLSLAVLNLVPFPALDGGRLAFIAVEALRGRAVDARVERWAHAVGYVLLIALVLAVSVQDVSRFNLIERVRTFFAS